LGSEEQSRGIEQIGKAITQMEQLTQRSAASAEESASAAQQLSAQAASLKDIVTSMNHLIGLEASRRSKKHIVPAAGPSKLEPRPTSPAMKHLAAKPVAKQPAFAVASKAPADEVFPMDSNFTEF
jgi:methyl-accepting chemotaxis protein/methyl-accepting chemotaxis protein-1 (serine sensor receptor)